MPGEPRAHALIQGRPPGLQGQLLHRPARDLAGTAASHLSRGGHSRVSGYGNRESGPVRVSFLLSEPFVHKRHCTQRQAFLRVLGPGPRGDTHLTRCAPITQMTFHKPPSPCQVGLALTISAPSPPIRFLAVPGSSLLESFLVYYFLFYSIYHRYRLIFISGIHSLTPVKPTPSSHPSVSKLFF